MSKIDILGIDIHDGLRLVNPKPVDVWSGPYESAEEANMVIPIMIRYPSMIVRVVNDIGTFLYWYKDGVENENLVQYLHEDIEKINNDLLKKYSEISDKITNKESDKFYKTTINNPSKVWEITHNLSKYPSVTVINNDKQVVIGDVQYIDDNKLTVTFSASFSGTIICN